MSPIVRLALAVAIVVLGIMAKSFSRRRSSSEAPGSSERDVIKEGLELTLAGRPAEAEPLFRDALAREDRISDYERVRLRVCLGDALMDMNRYEEAEDCFTVALQIGDASGSAQGSMVDLRLLQKRNPQEAMELAQKAFSLSTGKINQGLPPALRKQTTDLRRVIFMGRVAQAQLLLGQLHEAKATVGAAESLLNTVQGAPEPSALQSNDNLRNLRNLQITAAHWKIGLALDEMDESERAAEHFQAAGQWDPKGKYRLLAQQKVNAVKS